MLLESPESPIILTIPLSSVRTNSILVKWRPRFTGHSPIRSYNLQYSKKYQSWQDYKYGIPPVVNIPAHLNEIDVLKLDSSTVYNFRVRANNDVGSSPWSAKSNRQITHPKGKLKDM